MSYPRRSHFDNDTDFESALDRYEEIDFHDESKENKQVQEDHCMDVNELPFWLMTPHEFIKSKFPMCGRNMDADRLNNVSGNELVELIEEYESEYYPDDAKERSEILRKELEEITHWFDDDFDKEVEEIREMQAIRQAEARYE